MTLHQQLGHQSLQLALWLAPRARREAVLAIWSEFEHCETGQLAWATGGLWAALRWRIEADWLYATALIATPLAMPLTGLILFDRVFSGLALPPALWVTAESTVMRIMILLGALLLGWYRPANAVVTVSVGIALSFALYGSWTTDWFSCAAMLVLGTGLGTRLSRRRLPVSR